MATPDLSNINDFLFEIQSKAQYLGEEDLDILSTIEAQLDEISDSVCSRFHEDDRNLRVVYPLGVPNLGGERC